MPSKTIRFPGQRLRSHRLSSQSRSFIVEDGLCDCPGRPYEPDTPLARTLLSRRRFAHVGDIDRFDSTCQFTRAPRVNFHLFIGTTYTRFNRLSCLATVGTRALPPRRG
jgi:hypothetical protein